MLAAVRLGCNCNYDQLQDLAENHRALRRAMGIGAWDDEQQERKRFDWRRIESNLNLLRPETIEHINRLLIQEGHRLEPTAAETVRGDSFVAETNMHFPTDNSLIRDGMRKIFGLAATIAERFGLDGWRQARGQERTVSVEFRAARRWHPGIESAIGALQSGKPWSDAATGRSGDSHATSDWACWAGIFTSWANC